MSGFEGAGASRGTDDLHNEDTFLSEDGLGLYLVCDGLGSAPGGEVAAYLAKESIEHYLAEVDATRALSSGAVSVSTIEAAIHYALDCIADAIETRPDLAGMDSTISLLLIQGDRGFIGHAGDSRIYLSRGGRCVQLTADQEWTLVDSEGSRERKEGTRTPETFSIDLRTGDTFVLCTDGAETEVEDPAWIRSIETSSPRILASRIVSAAHRRDPGVDATVVVVRIREELEPAHAEPGWTPRPWILEAHAIAPADVHIRRVHDDLSGSKLRRDWQSSNSPTRRRHLEA